MYYNTFKEIQLSALGFGTMRLPLIPGGGQGDIDQDKVNEMTAYAINNGINYFDTAYPYHDSMSEIAIGKALSAFPRESYYLADKYPGHQIVKEYRPAEIFENQLKKCGVDYFDFYLLHNVNEHSLPVYLDEKWGMVKYFVEQRKLGRIRHLGFSAHGSPENMAVFLDAFGDEMEFCQIQLNYLDWTLQDAREKVALLNSRNIPIWVMEPVRGGALAKLKPEDEKRMADMRPADSVPSWAFRWLQGIEGVTMVLSGMSTLEQMKDNIRTFSTRAPLNEDEARLVYDIADRMGSTVPCTGCRYCCKGCPMELNIPYIISVYNDACVFPSLNLDMRLKGMGEAVVPSRCIGCGACAQACPQGIKVNELMPVIEEKFKEIPDWVKLSREREEAANRLKQK